MKYIPFRILIVVAISLTILSGCGGGKKNPVEAGSGFDIQITNNTDSFQFTATNAEDVSDLLSYAWTNSGTQATIIHSSSVDSGTALIYLYDGSGTLVYSNGLAASATEQSQVGTSGIWLIRISLNICWGDLGFQVQTL